jgi:predicted DNA-binding protein (MmcQ/YjbR family)
MNHDSLRKYCATLPGATVDIKWGADECHCDANSIPGKR